MPAPPTASHGRELLRSAEVTMADPVDVVPVLDRGGRGAVADRPRPGLVRRAEPGPHGPLVFSATQRQDRVALDVWGPTATPSDRADVALEEAHDWVGARDDGDLTALTAGHRALHRVARQLGPVRLSRMPRVQEAVGRAVLGQLVQRSEASRSVTQLAALAGLASPPGLWCWPTPDALRRLPAHALRRCGISQRSAQVLHAAARDAERLDRAWSEGGLDARLHAIPGLGTWTSGETRRHLGDPDVVVQGDDALPQLVCHALTGAEGEDCTDAAMLELLAPYAGQRGRVVALVLRAVFRGLLPRHPRRAPRAAFSQHRYW